MKSLENCSDENVCNSLKIYIEENFKKGNTLTPSMIQRRYNIGFNKTMRIFRMLHDTKIIQLYNNIPDAPIVL